MSEPIPPPVDPRQVTLSEVCVGAAVLLTLTALGAVVIAHAAVNEVGALISGVNTGLFALATGVRNK